MSGRVGSSRYHPFTATQWQELEHQALIFKYMASGIPIPSDLILPIRRSFFPSTNPSLAFPHQQQLPMVGWGSYHHHLGYGKKAEDPEPGRCRRTDGKKWRCSKDAYPDSKYCERHMHRGKNRSRKPVEMSLASLPTNHHHHSLYHSPPPPPPPPPLSISSTPELFYTGYSSSAKPPNTTGSYYTTENKDYYRYAHGMRDVDEYSFFSEASGAARESSSSSWPKLISTETQQQQHGYADYSKEESGKKQQHCFVLGADFKLDKPVKEEDREKVPLRHFFDEWPQKSKDSSPWIDLDEHSSSKTQLSISIPAMTSRYHNGY